MCKTIQGEKFAGWNFPLVIRESDTGGRRKQGFKRAQVRWR